jgi:hypothetical protein
VPQQAPTDKSLRDELLLGKYEMLHQQLQDVEAHHFQHLLVAFAGGGVGALLIGLVGSRALSLCWSRRRGPWTQIPTAGNQELVSREGAVPLVALQVQGEPAHLIG